MAARGRFQFDIPSCLGHVATFPTGETMMPGTLYRCEKLVDGDRSATVTPVSDTLNCEVSPNKRPTQ